MHTLLEKIRQVLIATGDRCQGIVIDGPVERKDPAIERLDGVVHRVINLRTAHVRLWRGAGTACQVRNSHQQCSLASQVAGIRQRTHKHSLRKREADAGIRSLPEDVCFMTAMTLCCRIEICDESLRMVLNVASTKPSDASR